MWDRADDLENLCALNKKKKKRCENVCFIRIIYHDPFYIGLEILKTDNSSLPARRLMISLNQIDELWTF